MLQSKQPAEIMLDLETMGTGSDAAIVAIGAVAFTDDIIDTFYIVVDLQSPLDAGGSVTGDTIMWWLKQSQDARDALRRDAKPLVVALTKLTGWCLNYDIEGLGGNGATFDNVILTNAYKAHGFDTPWPFWADRCFRTVKAMYPPLQDFKAVGEVLKHHALSDASWQAQYLMALRKEALCTHMI